MSTKNDNIHDIRSDSDDEKEDLFEKENDKKKSRPHKSKSNEGKNLEELMKIEARLKLKRNNLQLGNDFPSWLLGSEPK